MKLLNQSQLNKIKFNPVLNEKFINNYSTNNYNKKDLLNNIEERIKQGDMEDFSDLFPLNTKIPSTIGNWKILVNYKKIDDKVINKVVVVTPNCKDSHITFEEGCKERLMKKGYGNNQAGYYYTVSRNKKYIWLDGVIECVLDMLNAKVSNECIDNIFLQPDIRSFCNDFGIPANPFKCTEEHFKVVLQQTRDINSLMSKDECLKCKES